jgi:hypothetical protein
MVPSSFALTKWYLDCLDRDNRLVILYWASLQWRRLRVVWSSVVRHAPGDRVIARSSVRACDPPVHDGAATRWLAPRLGCAAELAAGVPRMAPQELAPGVTWTCVSPAANATIRLGSEVFRGTGYAEVMNLNVMPWTLGIRHLRWGRWISDDTARSVVWIDWNHEAGTRWVFLDGRTAGGTELDDTGVRWRGGSLTLDDANVAIDRGLGATVRRIPALRAVAPRWLVGGHEVRSTRAGVLRDGAAQIHGTAVDETVDFG